MCPKPNVAGILIRRGKEAQKGKVAVWRRGDMGRLSHSDRGRGQCCTWASLGLMATQDAEVTEAEVSAARGPASG